MDIDDLCLDDNDVLERVDEYTLYCHYLGFEPQPGASYQSPIRDDDETPSFTLFVPTKKGIRKEFLWKDKGGAGGGRYGDIFSLVQILYAFSTRRQAIEKVKSDFGLSSVKDNSPKLVFNRREFQPHEVEIRVASREFFDHELEWWKKKNVNRDLLRRFNTSSMKMYWTRADQKVPFFSLSMGFAYRIGSRYQLYFPLEKKGRKFLSSMSDHDLPGFEQLRYQSDTLIITKSFKDVMCLASFGFEAVSPRGENIMIPEPFLNYLQARYSRILILFDNDGKHNGHKYPYEKIYVPESTNAKDISQFCDLYGPEETFGLLTSLI